MSTSWLLFLLACGLTSAWLAQHKGYSARSWFWLGALFGVVALGVLARQPRRPSSLAREQKAARFAAALAGGGAVRCDSPRRPDDAAHR